MSSTAEPSQLSTTPPPTPLVRSLPKYAAGDLEFPLRVFGHDERIMQDTAWSEHSHPTHELIWHEIGAGSVTVGPRTWTIAPAIGLWVPAGVPHSGWTPAGVWQRAAHFNVSTQPLSDQPIAVEVTPLLRLLLARLICDTLSTTSYATTEAMILDVLEPAEHQLLLYKPENPLLAPIVKTLTTNPADNTSLDQWATRLNVSTRTITRAFSAETGLSFRRWTATAKAQHAVQRLVGGQLIDEVAFEVGYGSASAFTTAFRRVTGTTPGKYRATTR